MSKTTAALLGVAFASQLVGACASPQLVKYQLEESAPDHRAINASRQNYLPKIVVKESATSRAEKRLIDVRYYQ